MLQMARPRRVEPDGRTVWWDVPEKVDRLIAYCRQDVEVERALHRRLRPLPTASARFSCSTPGSTSAASRSTSSWSRLPRRWSPRRSRRARRRDPTSHRRGGRSGDPDSTARSRGCSARGIDADERRQGARSPSCSRVTSRTDVRRVLEIRAEAARTSTAKLRAFRARTCGDGRLRDNLLYHGAATGRWSGRGVQLQNLPRPGVVSDVEAAIATIRRREPGWWVDAFIGPPMAVVSDCLRGMLVAAPGMELIAADFTAIEARVLAWLAGAAGSAPAVRDRRRRLPPHGGRDLRRPADTIAKGSLERQLGKQAVLGCGYGLGAPKFRTTCANAGIHISAALAERVVQTYRSRNRPHRGVVAGARAGGAARGGAAGADRAGGCRPGAVPGQRLAFSGSILPSGRAARLRQPRIEERETPWGELRPQVTYLGVNSLTPQRGSGRGLWRQVDRERRPGDRPRPARRRDAPPRAAPATRSSSRCTTRSWPRCPRASAASRSSSGSCASCRPGRPAARSPPRAGAATGTGSKEGRRGELCRLLGGRASPASSRSSRPMRRCRRFHDQAGGPRQGAGPANGQGTWGGFDWLRHQTTEQDLARGRGPALASGCAPASAPASTSTSSTRPSRICRERGPTRSGPGAETHRPGAEAAARLSHRRRRSAASGSGSSRRTSEHKHLVELLGDGQQYVVEGIHPGTRRPYAWDLRPDRLGAGALAGSTMPKPRPSSPSSRLCSSCSAARRSSAKASAAARRPQQDRPGRRCAATSTGSPKRSR